MKQWVHKLVKFEGSEIADFALRDPHWILFMGRLREYSTERKLDNLEIYRADFLLHNPQSEQRRMEVQISTYIHGLLLTGYLTPDLKVAGK